MRRIAVDYTMLIIENARILLRYDWVRLRRTRGLNGTKLALQTGRGAGRQG